METKTSNKDYVALIADATGAYGHVHVRAKDWLEVIDILEDYGCEVVENQTDDYDSDDFINAASLKEVGLLTVEQLVKESSFIPHN